MSDRAETLARVLRLEPGRTALLVVDMQHGFVDPGEALEVPPAREVVPAIRALVEGFRARRLPVLFTGFTYSPAVSLLVGEPHPEHRPAVAGAPRGFGHRRPTASRARRACGRSTPWRRDPRSP